MHNTYLSAAMNAAPFGEPRPVAASQPAVARSPLLPLRMSCKAVARFVYALGVRRPAVCFCAALATAINAAVNGAAADVPPTAVQEPLALICQPLTGSALADVSGAPR